LKKLRILLVKYVFIYLFIINKYGIFFDLFSLLLQKGTGKWTAISSLDLGVPVTLIGEAVYSRTLSALKDERVRASKILSGPTNKKFQGDKDLFVRQLGQALYAAKLISYAQGFMLMREAAKDNNWDLNNAGIALMWRGGCIIRR
jgi:6-phosphogluconate dehydrogenase